MAEAAYIDWLDAIPAAVFLSDDDLILFANRSAAELIGVSAKELAGARLDTVLADNHLKTRAGSVPVRVTIAPVQHEGRSVSLITAQQATVQVAVPAAQSDLYRAALDGVVEGFMLIQAQRTPQGEISEFVIVDSNQQALEQLNKTRDQVVGCGFCELMSIDRDSAMFRSCVHVVEMQTGVQQEFYIAQRAIKDGWYQIQMIPIGDTIAIFNRDITERKEAEEVVQALAQEIEQQARMLDEILAATPDAFILFDRAGHYLYVNKRGLENSGLTAEQVTGKTWRELGFPEEAGFTFDKRLEFVFTTGKSITYEEQFPTLRGLRDFMTTLSPIHNPAGEVMLHAEHDLTTSPTANGRRWNNLS